AWLKHSRYRAVGIYIGGSERACGQRNLTVRWLRAEAAVGWHFFPMYVGPQAQYHQLRSPARQARRAANDAAAQAERLGFGPRTPIYYDMESFPPRQTGKVLRFSTAWTKRLHYLGFEAGLYSSSSSGIAQLARHYRSHSLTMPDVIYDALWNHHKNTTDSVLGSRQWQGRRLHQFSGNVTETHGGAKIRIDRDYLNVVLPTPGGSAQASRTSAQPDGTVDVFYRGPGHRLWHAEVRSGGESAPARLRGRLVGQPAAVTPVPGAIDVFYEGTDHKLWEESRRPGKAWSAPRRLSRMGTIGSPPSAVAQPNGVVDVFWKGSADNSLWHAQFSPGKGWRGPQGLGGSLASQPSPVETAPGTVQVFWKGTDLALWHVVRRPGRTWARPVRLGMGPLGGAPHATGNRSGAIAVFWHGAGNDGLWGTTFVPRHRWSGPLQLEGLVRSTPFPLMSPGGQIRVFWKGPHRQLWQVSRGPGGRWGRAKLAGIGRVRSGPAGAIGPGGAVAVFWRGRGHHLWFAAQSKGSQWGVPRSLGGRVA
ncbi:MAG: glycoside hydrolase domain-containing protein, partial [Actinomycetota bacterium]